MKLLARHLERDGSGSMTFMPEHVEDLWHLYNLVAVGDVLRAPTVRRVQNVTATGSSSSERVRLTLSIGVEKIAYEPEGGVMHVSGRVCEENPHVKRGQYHTLDLEPQRRLTLRKDVWDAIALERVTDATDVARSADLAAVVLQEGLAHVCLVSGSMTVVRSRIEMSIPRKRRGSSAQHDRALQRFFDAIMTAVLRHVDFTVVKAVLIGSPGFLKDSLVEYMLGEAVRREGDARVLTTNKEKFLRVPASSGHKFALKELLADPAVAAMLTDTKAAGEVRVLNAFYAMLGDDPDRAPYGPRHVRAAHALGAVQELLLCDELFRAADPAARRAWVELVEGVRDGGGRVHIFSALHVSGEQLQRLTGVAAILRFPVNLEDLPDEATAGAAGDGDGGGDGAAARGDASDGSSSFGSSSDDERRDADVDEDDYADLG